VSVRDLLGRFNHEIAFPEDWEFVILHGPNGVGKTKILELIAAVANNQLSRLLRFPFAGAEFQFSDGSVISITGLAQLGDKTASPSDGPYLQVQLSRPALDPVSFQVKPGSHRSRPNRPPVSLRILETELPLVRVEQDAWLDRAHGDHISLSEIAHRYADSEAVERLGIVPESPPEFQDFLADFNVHLIETQRLLQVNPRGRASDEEVETSTVLRYAEDLTNQLSATLADNSRLSQQLDRTFPGRVLDFNPEQPDSSGPSLSVTDEQIRERYKRQSELRDELAEIAVLDAFAADIALPERELQDWERRVLWTYLEDAEKKLSTFRHLLDRVRLLRRIVNSRFLFQELVIDRSLGFKFVTETDQEIGPDSLSSGEQHELVLVYDLLFNVGPETTVLIDEPELSLHVSWQQKFLDDMVEISKLASLRFVIATHSPQIVHTWTERMVPLQLLKESAQEE
jgi:predicted ATP-binding protein involved in virulence